jgi:hypothetical protein
VIIFFKLYLAEIAIKDALNDSKVDIYDTDDVLIGRYNTLVTHRPREIVIPISHFIVAIKSNRRYNYGESWPGDKEIKNTAVNNIRTNPQGG